MQKAGVSAMQGAGGRAEWKQRPGRDRPGRQRGGRTGVWTCPQGEATVFTE